jgi:hypothetical protein
LPSGTIKSKIINHFLLLVGGMFQPIGEQKIIEMKNEARVLIEV